jgi:VanZ family protein
MPSMLPGERAIKGFILYWMPAIVWIGLIFLLSNTPSSGIDEVKKGPLALLPPTVASVATSSLLVHPLEFGVLAVLIYRLLASYKSLALRYVIIFTLLVTIGYGALDEFHQSFVQGRSSTLADVGLDTIGAIIGVTVAALGAKAKDQSPSPSRNGGG